ncbi:MAG TPA: DsbA family protein [Aliidongia sp.]|uniref:DsbA family protein n=1 Tax=Aliidongia sp. TaxID=1914230 RepID=UPI002DDD5109|nr:DsbA family protein [Aliidongia sp.]HEV2676596.1 DsbA family protein [Aliidongia sp.]
MHRILLIALASFATLAQAQAAAPATPVVEVAAAPAIRPDDVVLGKSDAPITVFEYASLTCPHCGDFSTKTFPQVKKDWIDTGKVRWVYRDFPFDPVALKAHIIAHCGGPERFYGFLDVFYAQQRSWFRNNPDESVAALTQLTKFGGVSEAQVKACLSDDKLSKLVVTNRQSGDDAGVDSTPTFFINGSKSTGFKEYDEFQKLLAAAS